MITQFEKHAFFTIPRHEMMQKHAFFKKGVFLGKKHHSQFTFKVLLGTKMTVKMYRMYGMYGFIERVGKYYFFPGA